MKSFPKFQSAPWRGDRVPDFGTRFGANAAPAATVTISIPADGKRR